MGGVLAKRLGKVGRKKRAKERVMEHDESRLATDSFLKSLSPSSILHFPRDWRTRPEGVLSSRS